MRASRRCLASRPVSWTANRQRCVHRCDLHRLHTIYTCVSDPRDKLSSTIGIHVVKVNFNATRRGIEDRDTITNGPHISFLISLARLLRDGSLPEKSGLFMIGGTVIAALIAAFKVHLIAKGSPYAKWVPSGVAFAIGFLNTPSFSMARLIGGIIEYVYHRRVCKRGAEAMDAITIILVGSGFVLGEGVMSIVSLILKTFGIPSSCFGCIEGVCSC